MKIAGIILVVLQGIAVIGSLIAGRNPFAGGIFGSLGYFLVGIIGVILLIVAAVKKNKRNQEINNSTDASASKKYEDDKSEANVHANKKYEDNEAQSKPYSFRMNDEQMEKYTRMFRQPFSQVIGEEGYNIHNKCCHLYIFHPNYARSQICAFQYLFEVKGNKPRFFAVEYSYGNQYCLCEWVFEGEKEKKHANYGEFSPLNLKENVLKKLYEIIT